MSFYRNLQEQITLLTTALEGIADPIRTLEAELPEGAKLDGHMAMQLAGDASFLRDKAKTALSQLAQLRGDTGPARKVIFLDIDEVLVTHGARVAQGERLAVDPTSAGLVRRLLQETGAKIVVSSTWRKGSDCRNMDKLLALMGLGTDSLYRQPTLDSDGLEDWLVEQTAWRTDPCHDNPRGARIKAWLETHGKHVARYVIFDDDGDMLDEQRDHFVHVDGMVGLTFRDYQKARQILGAVEPRFIRRDDEVPA